MSQSTLSIFSGRRYTALFAVLSQILLFARFQAPALAAGGQVLHGIVPNAVSRLAPVKSLASSNHLDLVIVLPLRHQDVLTNLLRDIYDPASPNYHRYLKPEQFAEQFGPATSDYQNTVAFMESNGLRVTHLHPNRTLLDVNGSVADIEKLFHVNMRVYSHPTEARNFYAPDAEPSVNFSVPILAVRGLDNFVVPHPINLTTKFSNQLADAIAFTNGSGPKGYFIGKDFRAAYAPGVALNGSGQAVGLFELDTYYPSDVATYENLAGLPNVPLTNVFVDASKAQPGPNNVEVALDIDMAISMAPGLSKVIVYMGPSGDDVLNRMATDDQAAQLSCSWTFGSQVDAVREQIFQQFAAQGQSFFQASGDFGAGTVYPMTDDAYVTSVGGTSLTTSTPGGAWTSETVWPDSTGGVSPNYSIPIWQQNVSMSANHGSTTRRNFPDVACVADGIWLVANNGDQGVVGGTSAAAPLWAGFAALVNQQAAASGKPNVGFVNPAIYAIGQSSIYGAAFHDITAGNNTNSSSPTNFFAATGYDLCTGWGTPGGSNLINALLAPPNALQITPTSPLVFTGPVGGPFTPSQQNVILTNAGKVSLNWTLGNSASWLAASTNNGNLTPNGLAEVVTFIPSPAASNLVAGSYSASIVFTNLSDGSVQSRQVLLNVDVPPIITSQPADETLFAGMNATFSVATSSNGMQSFQWQYDNGSYVTNLNDGGTISGSATSTLTVSNVSSANVGAYFVVVSNAAGVAVSSNAFLSIVPWRPYITMQPQNQMALPGETITFTVSAFGIEPLVYQWQYNGTNLADGANVSGSASATLTISNVSASITGTYSVVITNAMGAVTSTGAVLSVSPPPSTLVGVSMTTLYSFTGSSDGGGPNALLQVTNGILYGTTQHGGAYSAGTVFQLTTNGVFGGMYSFTGGNDGETPFVALAFGPDGSLYGTAFEGGANTNGTVFKIALNGSFTPLVSFNVTNGDLPYAGLTLGKDTNFYGTTYQGGAFGLGTVFRMTTNGALTTLYSFSGTNDGSQPAGNLVQGSDGNFYGTTYKRGINNYGSIFKVATNGLFTVVTSFNNTNGAFPSAGLVQDAAGNFYGTTTRGGVYSNGVIFMITPGGVMTNLYSFTGGADGQNPHALTLGADGNFYGTTAFGGTYGDGTAFVISPDGTLATLVEFDGYNGANPQSALMQGMDGYLYGTTQSGGAAGQGTIFRLGITSAPQITAQPANQTVFMGEIVRFSVSVLGNSPFTYEWLKNGTNFGDGGIISGSASRVLTLNGVGSNDIGSYYVIVSNSLGSITSSVASLAIASSPPLIVTQPTNQTLSPGATVTYSVSVVGNAPLVYQWQEDGTNLSDGGSISGSSTSSLRISSATEANNGIYDVVITNALGFAVSSNATLTIIAPSAAGTTLSTLHWFNSTAGGSTPNGLMCASNGNLYGTTQSGGATNSSGGGTVFEMTTNGQFATLISFSGNSGPMPGLQPMATLVEDTNGNFYGTTEYGGTNNLGTVFKLASDNTFYSLYSFTGGSDGADPTAPLIFGTDGNLYSVTPGNSTAGNIFKITPGGVLTNLYSFTGGMDGGAPARGLVQGNDGNFYGLTDAGGASNDGGVFKMTPNGALTNLYSFTGHTDGYEPVGTLVQGTDGNFYGATEFNTISGFRFYGTFFKVTPGGKLTTLYALNFTNGTYPFAGLLQGSDGNFYGTTFSGGSSSDGTVFRITPGGTLTTLVSFDGFDDGAHPESALVEASQGVFFGTTTSGGPGGAGTIFRLAITSAPQITSQPASQTNFAGATVAFIVADFGAAPLYYQWLKNGAAMADGGHVSGSASRVLLLNDVSLADMGSYSLVVSNALGAATSSSASLTVIPPPMFQPITMSNGIATLHWTATSGQKYQLQYNADLNTTNWINLGGVITATNGFVSATNSIGSNSQRFYRVILTH